MHIGIFWQILIATLSAGILPLILIAVIALNGYQRAAFEATNSTKQVLDQRSLESLQLRTIETANAISRFLHGSVQDIRSLALIAPSPQAYQRFYRNHTGEIWERQGTNDDYRQVRYQAPLYKEIVYIDATGQEQLRLLNGEWVPDSDLRNVADPANTTYKTETYFNDTKDLRAGGVYVSNVTAWNLTREQQLGTAENSYDAIEGEKYDAVIRFTTPVFDEEGNFDGIVMLGLDFRHIMEFILHILPTSEQNYTVYPNYASGNYAYLFDHEGWHVVHPRQWVLRGLDENGELVSHATGEMRENNPALLAIHPFNMQFGDWADPNLPLMYEAVLRREDGFVITENQSGAEKATTYAPIEFNEGVYAEAGIFGGVAIGAELAEFHEPANLVGSNIANVRRTIENNTLLITGVSIFALIFTVTVLARRITRPVVELTQAAYIMEQGELDVAKLDNLEKRRWTDEVSTLSAVFKDMAEKVQLRQRRLQERIAQLNIQIDEQKKEQQVAEVAESDYFQKLQANAEKMRARFD
ncbi:MAG: HAMP domain-containing protein, partial [Anaerolineales bacterium]|nr:HAMP domain-containing protein [Anaerolineales bacterium]